MTDDVNLKDLYAQLNKVDPSEEAAKRENQFFSNYSGTGGYLSKTHIRLYLGLEILKIQG